MTAPLLSVIIPTHNRPQYLPRAVESALQAAPNGNVEVIVVPNGGDETWKISLANLVHDPRIIVSPVEKGHANVARNHGLRLAKGKYVRFLDDDDFFYKDNATLQLQQIIAEDSDISMGLINKIKDDEIVEILGREVNYDLVESIIAQSRLTLPTCFIFRKDFISTVTWDENLDYMQDTKFIFDVLNTKGTFKFSLHKNVVGAWDNHSFERVSNIRKLHERFLIIFSLLYRFKSYTKYKQVWKDAMWSLLHQGVKVKSIYWLSKLNKFYKENPEFIPQKNIYICFAKFSSKLIILDCIILPYRKIKFLIGK